jgi:hypothetical protein
MTERNYIRATDGVRMIEISPHVYVNAEYLAVSVDKKSLTSQPTGLLRQNMSALPAV